MRERVSGLKLWLAAALLALSGPVTAQVTTTIVAQPAPQTAAAPRPAIWLLQDEDTKIYLFGTVHIFPATLRWRSPGVERIIAEADELVMETPETSLEEVGNISRFAGSMQLGKAIPVLERVSPAARGRLREVLESTGLPISYFDRMQTWAIAFMLTGAQAAGADADSAATRFSGAEEELGAAFRRRKRPISGVETIQEQINVFASMNPGEQRRFLEAVVAPGYQANGPSTDAAWAAGDVEAIAAEMQAMPPELYHRLLTVRNRNWTGWLIERMDEPGTVMFAVGAGHLAGPDSVQRMLEARGYEVRRIE